MQVALCTRPVCRYVIFIVSAKVIFPVLCDRRWRVFMSLSLQDLLLMSSKAFLPPFHTTFSTLRTERQNYEGTCLPHCSAPVTRNTWTKVGGTVLVALAKPSPSPRVPMLALLRRRLFIYVFHAHMGAPQGKMLGTMKENHHHRVRTQ